MGVEDFALEEARLAFSQGYSPNLLKASEAILCFAVKAKTLYTMAYRSKISSYKVGSWRMFNFDDLGRTFKRRSHEEMIEILRSQLLHKLELQQKRYVQ